MRALLESTGTRFASAAYAPRDVLFRQGDPCDRVWHIEKGRVALAVMTRNGQEAICGLLGPGAFVGEEALGGQTVRRESATAMERTEVLIVSRAQMAVLLHTHPAALDRFLDHLITRGARLQANLADQLLNPSERRLARTLLLLADCDGPRACGCQIPRVSQETIAEMVGTTRSRVNVFMTRFKKLGFLEDDHGVLRVTPSLLNVAGESVAEWRR